jgi:hypothetical protein
MPDPGHAADAGSVDARGVEAATSPPDGDDACLRSLESKGVDYKRLPAAGGMRTPVEIVGPIGNVALISRGRRSAVMDCVLARALAQAGGVFGDLGIAAVTFSAAYDLRTRRGSSEASAHAYGLAIDVHTVRGPFGEYDVRQHFERGIGRWRGLEKGPEALGACVGEPATAEGRVLRQLACRLKLHPAFRVIVSPDDDSDHQDHLHLEARSDFYPPPPGAPPLAAVPAPPRPAQAEPETNRPSTDAAAKPKRHTKRKPHATKKRKPKRKAKRKTTPRKQRSHP